MRKLLVGILLILLLIINVHNQDHRTYKNTLFKFVVSYPTSWEVQETKIGAMFIASPIKNEESAFAENVDISFNELNGTPMNMDKNLEKTVRDLRSYKEIKNLKVLEREGRYRKKIGRFFNVFLLYMGRCQPI